MTYLLDTHSVLWFWFDVPNLSPVAKSLIASGGNRRLISPATPWEVAIKVSTKKLLLGSPFLGFFPRHVAQTGFEWLPITDKHLGHVSSLTFHHRDPFDRLLIAQALVEGIPIVSCDPAFDAYGVVRIW
jgi:PIN domain nuclease of toxin-antitoxin system